MNRPHPLGLTALACFAAFLPTAAQAFDFIYSGFGTVGAAISDHEGKYQRYLDDDGTFMRDSLLGLRLDGKFNEQWAVTTQIVLMASDDEDDVVEPQLKWTMLSYRPANDWLIRAGRLSLGGLLQQQNLDVGVTYDMARLPSEVYLLSSAYDFDGASVTKTWNVGDYEVALDASFGMQNRYYRTYHNGVDQEVYYSADITAGGLVLTINDYDQTIYRLGWHLSEIDPDEPDEILSKYTFVPLGYGMYTLGSPEYTATTNVNTIFVGAQVPLGGFLLSGEGTALIADDFEAGPPTYSAYISLSRKIDKVTPYITYAQTWTSGLDTWRQVKGATPVPQYGISARTIEDAASAMAVYDQSSWMFGASYSISPQQKIKTEVMITHVGERSAMFDDDIAHENVTVFSLSYNFAF